MVRLGTERLRIGGTSGEWHLVFGDLVDVMEGVVEVEFSACRQCRRVQMKLPPGIRPEDTPLFGAEAAVRDSPLTSDARPWNPMQGPPEGDR